MLWSGPEINVIKAVLDANVWVSGLISRRGPPGKIVDLWLAKEFDVAVSPHILLELVRVFQYPRIRERVETEDLQNVILGIVDAVDMQLGKLELNVLTIDPDDNLYLACAVEIGASYLVTGNQKHFAEVGEVFQGIRIVSPRKFLDALGVL